MAAPVDPNKLQLKRGLEAAKNKDYPVAIAHLRQVQPGPHHEQAQQALVIALDKSGNVGEAIAHCQPLLNARKPTTRQWAEKSLAKLQRRMPTAQQRSGITTAQQSAGQQLDQRPTQTSSERLPHNTTIKATVLPKTALPETIAHKIAAKLPTERASAILEKLPALRAKVTASAKAAGLTDSAFSMASPPTPISPNPAFKNAPAPQQWQSLPPVATSRWTWSGLFLLSLWGLYSLSEARFLPSFVANYSLWIVGGLGAIAYGIIWINHRSLVRQLAPLKLRLQEICSILILGWLVPFSVPTAIRLLNNWLSKIPVWSPYIQPSDDLREFLLWTGLVLLGLLPQGISFLLRLHGPWQSLTPSELAAICPGTKPLLRQFFRSRHGVQLPKLLCLDSPIPLLLSYGHRPRNARIVFSQGLLARLSDEQLTALVAGELGHIQSQTFVVLPWLNAFLQLPLGVYASLSRLGNLCQAKLKTPMDVGWRFFYRSGLVASGVGSAIAYGAFKLWRWPLLWLSRQRLAYGDRLAVDLLGDPNAYGRALMAYSQALVEAVAAAEQTPLLVEAFELLLPVGLPDALTANFAPTALPRDKRFQWDAVSPYRRWLSLNNSHEPLGDRLAHIATYAKRSRVAQEVELTTESTQILNPFAAIKARSKDRRQRLRATFATWKPLLYQGLPFYGAVLGLAFGFGLWALGATVSLFGGWWFDWVYGDRQLLWGSVPLGVGIGLIIRTNAFFPQRASREKSPEAAAIALLSEPDKLPIAAEPVEFSGKLVGRPGLANWLGQDLLLLSEQGPLRLHWCSPLGPAGNLWPKFLRPSFLLNRDVIVSGWLRRGATLWLDVEQIRTASGGRSSQRGHPMWAAVMAGIAILWSVVILLPAR